MQRAAIITGVCIVLGLALALYGGPTSEVLGRLAFGWLFYPARVFPRVTIVWDGVATGLVCLALFTIGLHRILKWLYGEVQRAGSGVHRPWSIRWTVSLVALVVVMFVVGISATAVVHQTGWLVAARRALVEKKTLFRYEWGSSVAHLKQIGMSSYRFGKGSESPPWDQPDPDQPVLQSWMTEILPDMSIMLGGKLRPDLPWNDPRNSAYFKAVIPIYLNPEVGVIRNPEGYGLSHYAGNIHVLRRDGASHRMGSGEASTTILAGEAAEEFKPWGDPTNLRDPGLGVNKVPGGFGGPSGSGANFVFMDGSVRFLRDTTSREVLRRLSLPKPVAPSGSREDNPIASLDATQIQAQHWSRD
jgi:prepilin-type processing-associated H-X9-DG protein